MKAEMKGVWEQRQETESENLESKNREKRKQKRASQNFIFFATTKIFHHKSLPHS
jgi:hypothetical protein